VRLSPFAIGGAAGLAGMALLAPATGEALGRLATARAERARLESAAVAPRATTPLVPPGLAIAARSDDEAVARLAARIRALAAQGGVLVEEAAPAGGAGSLVTVRLRVSGSEGAVLGLVDALERGTPLVRFARWRVEGAGGTVRLTGETVASWR